MRKYIIDTYTKKEIFLYNDIKYNNIGGQFATNANFNLTKLLLFFISIPFILHQFYYIRKGGVTWDENLDIYGSGKNIEVERRGP